MLDDRLGIDLSPMARVQYHRATRTEESALRRLSTALILPIAACLLVVGCTAVPQAVDQPTDIASPTPSPTPTDRVLAVAEAGVVYLVAVCGSNTAGNKLDAAFRSNDLKRIKKNAKRAREAARESASILVDHSAVWPEGVGPDVDEVVDSLLASAAYYEELAKADSIEQINAATFEDDSKPGAAQRVRLSLDLPSDTDDGCEDLGKLIF